MSFARSDVRKDNSFRNAKAPLLQKIFHLLSTTAIFCLLSVARVWPGVYRPRAVLAPASRLGVRLPSTRLFASREPVTPWREGPRWPSLRARTPFWGLRAGLAPVCRPRAYLPLASPSLLGVRPFGGHLRGLAPRFGARKPVAPWRGAPRWPSLRARTPFWGPRARRSLAWAPSGAIPAGSHPVLGPASPSLLGARPLWGHLRGLADMRI